ncbi:MAG: sulfurtransferase FdhD [Planctomycetota bacterium]
MRTPADDFELAAGFLFTEGLLKRRDDVLDVSYCVDGTPEPQLKNAVRVTLRAGVACDLVRVSRNFYTTSSCGVCGKASLEALAIHAEPLPVPQEPLLSAARLQAMPERLRAAQAVFERTGGLHAAALFSAAGELLDLREDVGRHNALDKLIGAHFLRDELPLRDRVLLVSGRASYELLQKAVMAGIPVVAAVGAPSSLAVETAERFNVTLAGFLRASGCNIYACAKRLN